MSRTAPLVALASFLALAPGALAQTPLGVFPGMPQSQALALTPDGSTIVGNATVRLADFDLGTDTDVHPARWTTTAGPIDMGWPAGLGNNYESGAAFGVSNDGSVLVGGVGYDEPDVNNGFIGRGYAFRWTQVGGYQRLTPVEPDALPSARGVSGDGSIVAGTGRRLIFDVDGFISDVQFYSWTWSQALGYRAVTGPGGLTNVDTYGVSNNGTTLFGSSSNFGVDNLPQAALWNASTLAFTQVGVPGAYLQSQVVGMTADATKAYVVAYGEDINDIVAFSWTQTGGFVALPTPPGYPFSLISGVSHDGSVILGTVWFIDANFERQEINGVWVNGAFRPLVQYGQARGVNVDFDAWAQILRLSGISGDGSTIIGYGIIGDAFQSFKLVIPPFNCVADFDNGSGNGIKDGGVGIEDLLYYLAIFEGGTVEADVDNGSGTGTPDGGVGIEDLLYFLQRFENGC